MVLRRSYQQYSWVSPGINIWIEAIISRQTNIKCVSQGRWNFECYWIFKDSIFHPVEKTKILIMKHIFLSETVCQGRN
ncbi:MAG: hypothetical protein K1563_10590 [Candidatus Thiodiazotropha sp. (ex. Lucinisca nassula)]|nr:hypothetical protein [Candidatus Thiodiazotropha sp. (ex. Lucinisca nassula)]